MATDNTELTFIRCHSCRSLIPAMSVRCRMCGAELQDEPSASTQDSSSADKPMASKKVPVPEEVILESQEVVDNIEDPIKDFFEDNSEHSVEEVSRDASELVEDKSPENESYDQNAKVDKELEELDRLLDDLSATSAEDEVVPPAPPVISEPEPVKASVDQETVVEAKEKEVEVKKEVAPRKKSTKAKKINLEKEDKVSSVDSNGKIFGWFVSYSSPEGRSIELREGKFFISRDRLKESDLVVDDDSISTPHAMITLSSSLGFQIQDLMSEHGLYIKRSNSKKYELIDDIEVIENGDWLRFGNVDYQVVLIPTA